MLSGCGWAPQSKTGTGTLPEAKARFPFSQKEPEAYSAEAVVTAGGVEQKWFVARRGDLSRIDLDAGTPRWRIELRGPTPVSILPGQKVFAEHPLGTEPMPSSADRLSRQFFAGADYRSYVELDREGGSRVFKAEPNDISNDDIRLWVDDASGMIVRQEIRAADGSSSMIFELRGLKLEADEGLFTVPAGLRRVTMDELERIAAK